MLVDIREDWPSPRFRNDHFHWDVFDEDDTLALGELERVSFGVYRGIEGMFSFSDTTVGLIQSDSPFSPWLGHDVSFADRMDLISRSITEDWPHDYGVCDHPQQIIDRWPQLALDGRRYVIGLRRIVRADEPAEGGWRWHKWGEYIGAHLVEHEYLYDEVGIDAVECFSIYEMTPLAVGD